MVEGTTIEFKREYNEKVINTMLAFLNLEATQSWQAVSISVR